MTLTGGTLLLMWLGEQITSRGIGNGVSLIIFAGIVAVLPRGVWQMFAMTRTGSLSVLGVLAMAGLAAGVIVTIVFMERAQRRLLTQYPRRQTGSRSFGGDASFLPLKVNISGVMAPIFASSLLLLPTTAMGFLANAELPAWAQWMPSVVGSLQHGQPAFVALYAALIVFFCSFVPIAGVFISLDADGSLVISSEPRSKVTIDPAVSSPGKADRSTRSPYSRISRSAASST